MNAKQTVKRSSGQQWAMRADDALQEARDMPPGPERVAMLKKAGLLRNAADMYGTIFADGGKRSE